MMIIFNKTNIDTIWTMYEGYNKGLSGVMHDHREEEVFNGAGRSIHRHLANYCRKKDIIPI